MVERKKTNQAKARKKVRTHIHIVAAVVLTFTLSTPGSNDEGNCFLLFYNLEFVHNISIYSGGVLWSLLLKLLQGLDHLLFKREGDETLLPHR